MGIRTLHIPFLHPQLHRARLDRQFRHPRHNDDKGGPGTDPGSPDAGVLHHQCQVAAGAGKESTAVFHPIRYVEAHLSAWPIKIFGDIWSFHLGPSRKGSASTTTKKILTSHNLDIARHSSQFTHRLCYWQGIMKFLELHVFNSVFGLTMLLSK